MTSPTREKNSLEIAFIRTVNFVGNISTGRFPQAIAGAIGGRMMGYPWSIGAFQWVTTGVCMDIISPIEERCRKHFGSGPNDINKKGATLIEGTLIAVAIVGPAAITLYCAPTVLNMVASYAPNFLASWISVDATEEYNLTSLALITIAPFITEICLRGSRKWNESVEREKTIERQKVALSYAAAGASNSRR